MDADSKGLLKRKLFVLGLKMKWQEKVLSSAQTFADFLHQARAAEEQGRQLGKVHLSRTTEPTRPEGMSNPIPPKKQKSTSAWSGQNCGSTHHKAQDCTLWRTTEATGMNSAVMADLAMKPPSDSDKHCRQVGMVDESRV